MREPIELTERWTPVGREERRFLAEAWAAGDWLEPLRRGDPRAVGGALAHCAEMYSLPPARFSVVERFPIGALVEVVDDDATIAARADYLNRLHRDLGPAGLAAVVGWLWPGRPGFARGGVILACWGGERAVDDPEALANARVVEAPLFAVRVVAHRAGHGPEAARLTRAAGALRPELRVPHLITGGAG